MTRSPDVRTIETRTHGRYLVRRRASGSLSPLLVGFHGYAENAERHLAALEQIPGSERWLLVAVQGLHPFYNREQTVVANWMTRQDRELAIADNVRYVGAVLDAVRCEYQVTAPVVFAGFSQGVAMAYRAAAHYDAAAVLALAGDVPPDVGTVAPTRLPRVLIGRGTHDPSYSEAKHQADLRTLQRLGVAVESCVFDGGHEWSADFHRAAAAVLRGVV